MQKMTIGAVITWDDNGVSWRGTVMDIDAPNGVAFSAVIGQRHLVRVSEGNPTIKVVSEFLPYGKPLDISLVKSGDFYRKQGPTNYRVWKVVGLFAGATSQEDLVGITTIDRKNGNAHGKEQEVLFVPAEVFKSAGLERC